MPGRSGWHGSVRWLDVLVTEILRVIAQRLRNRAMFKGGTSLSRGCGLTTRFSEDIDLFVNPQRFTPRPDKNRMDQILKELTPGFAGTLTGRYLEPRDGRGDLVAAWDVVAEIWQVSQRLL